MLEPWVLACVHRQSIDEGGDMPLDVYHETN